MLNLLLLLLGIAPLVFSFHVPRFVVRPATAVVKASKIQVESDERAVGLALCRILEQEYQRSIAEKNSFVFCISGGSMLKMLSHLNGVSGIDWSKCTMVANDSLVAVSDQNIIYCTTSFTYIYRDLFLTAAFHLTMMRLPFTKLVLSSSIPGYNKDSRS